MQLTMFWQQQVVANKVTAKVAVKAVAKVAADAAPEAVV